VSANTKSAGYAPASVLSPELTQIAVAQGSTKVENPTDSVAYYGYDNDVLGPGGQPLMVPTPAQPATEAHKTEPDKNTYLVFKDGLTGADPAYDYGTHFLFQGHEGGTPGYITRINLDADAAHRVTLLATQDKDGHAIATIDGSTWEPWAKRLLFTTESASNPTYAATPGYPSTVEDVSGALGRGGYEGIQDDEDGNIWIVEDIGGANKPGTVARIPNSFVYRYVPQEPGDLHDGKLQVLQVLRGGTAITQATQTALQSDDQKAVHTYGSTLDTQWVTIHDTAVDGHDPFNANVKAKAANGTPFKRPENGLFRPGSKFKEFYFDETGDTNATSVENDCCGGWTAVLKLTQHDPSAATGKLSLVYKGRCRARRLRQQRVLLEEPPLLRRGRGRHATRAAERARLRVHDRRHRRLFEAGERSAPLVGGGTRRVRDARLGQRRLRQERWRQRDHRSLRLGRRPVEGGNPRASHAAPVARERQVARLLHPAARRQPDVRGASQQVAPLASWSPFIHGPDAPGWASGPHI
jgi:hypothetical protein